MVVVGQCQSRGPRCASWMKDYINDIGKFGRRSAIKVFFLESGIKAWVKEFEGAMMEGFDEKYWEKFK
jgi:arsenical-resistance protein 2